MEERGESLWGRGRDAGRGGGGVGIGKALGELRGGQESKSPVF